MIGVLEIIIAIVAIAGAVEVARGRRRGLACWVVSNLLSVGYMIATRQYWLATQYAVFWCAAIGGWVHWKREGIGT